MAWQLIGIASPTLLATCHHLTCILGKFKSTRCDMDALLDLSIRPHLGEAYHFAAVGEVLLFSISLLFAFIPAVSQPLSIVFQLDTWSSGAAVYCFLFLVELIRQRHPARGNGQDAVCTKVSGDGLMVVMYETRQTS